jgi:hypothetical protein
VETAQDDMEEQLKRLFWSLKDVDDKCLPESERSLIRLVVARLEELEIRMDGSKNHARGHVHIKYKKDGHRASYAIDDGLRLAGELPRYYDRVIREWIIENHWTSVQEGKRVQKGKTSRVITRKIEATVYD